MIKTLTRASVAALLATAMLCAGTTAAAQDDDNRRLQQIERQLDATEPSVDDVIQAAMDFYNLDEDSLESIESRAAWKNALPRVTGDVRFNSLGTDVDKFDFIQFPDQQAGVDRIGGTVQEYRVGVTWDLPRLVYNNEVLDTYALRGQRQSLLKEVIRLYYLRRRLKINFMLNPPKDAASRVASQLRIDEVTASIDALTDGVFRDWAKRQTKDKDDD